MRISPSYRLASAEVRARASGLGVGYFRLGTLARLITNRLGTPGSAHHGFDSELKAEAQLNLGPARRSAPYARLDSRLGMVRRFGLARGSAWLEARLGSRLGLARGSAWLEARLGSRLGLARGSAWLEARLGSRLGLARGSAWLEARLGSRLGLGLGSAWLGARLGSGLVLARSSAWLEARLSSRLGLLGLARGSA